MGRPLKDKDFSEIDRMVMEGKIPDARGRTWNLSKARNEKFLKAASWGMNLQDRNARLHFSKQGPYKIQGLNLSLRTG